VGSSELAAYQELATRHTFVRSLAGNTCDIYDFTKSMRVAIALAEGIPFGLHDAIGDLVLDRESGSFSNYNDFCEKVISEADKVKFKPVLNFWTNIVNENGDVNAAKIEKIQSLHIILNVLKFTQIQ
ncbi:MAG: hypothetical protein ACE5I1_19010, partial [bacterium]